MADQTGDRRISPYQNDPSKVISPNRMSTPTSLELSQIYALIDSILPFEACLYYQVAPLSIDGSCLIMGTVDLDDPAVIEYVTKQLSYINYSIRFQKIESDWHRDLLSQYLKHTAQNNAQQTSHPTVAKLSPASAAVSPESADSTAAATPAPVETPPSAPVSATRAESQVADDDLRRSPAAPPAIAAETSAPPTTPASTKAAAAPQRQVVDDEQLQATLILEQIEELTAIMPRDFTSQLMEAEPELASPPTATKSPTTTPSVNTTSGWQVAEAAELAAVKPTNTAQAEAAIAPPTRPSDAVSATPQSSPLVEQPNTRPETPAVASAAPLTASSTPAPTLSPDNQYDDISRLLCALPPRILMQALLEKVVGDGIGRLYFKREADKNRILWSRNGVLEGLIEPVDSQILQAVINEFKRFTHVDLTPATKSIQVESERTSNGERILLRLQIAPSHYGEQATLQVLRGEALKFHQQQQVDRLGRDALDAAETLQQRLNAIRDRARGSLNFQPTRSETLPTLLKLLKELEAQVHEIEAAYDAHEQ